MIFLSVNPHIVGDKLRLIVLGGNQPNHEAMQVPFVCFLSSIHPLDVVSSLGSRISYGRWSTFNVPTVQLPGTHGSHLRPPTVLTIESNRKLHQQSVH